MHEKYCNTRFWKPGFSLFADELRKEEMQRLEELKARMKGDIDPARKEVIKRQIAGVKAEFIQKRKNARDSMFLR